MTRLTFKMLEREAKKRNLTIEPIGKRAFSIWEGHNESGVSSDCENLTEAWDEIYNWDNELALAIRKANHDQSNVGDDICDQCMRSNVVCNRTNSKGETICVDCDETYHENPEEDEEC